MNTLSTLKHILELAGCDLSLWGVGSAKTLSHLVNELESEDCRLIVGRTVTRDVYVATANIFFQHPIGDERFVLKETKQVFKDGRERVRDLSSSIAEKIKIGESPSLAIVRGIEEELGIALSTLSPVETSISASMKESPSYPMLTSSYTTYAYDVKFDISQYSENGYSEEQVDKTTYWHWEKIN